ncbi:MAG: WD40 repeat domain-containing protein [Planctomycetes bacterium]|nr:WD40 repeat domain-containing protein [Planctomycetota bacterium]
MAASGSNRSVILVFAGLLLAIGAAWYFKYGNAPGASAGAGKAGDPMAGGKPAPSLMAIDAAYLAPLPPPPAGSPAPPGPKAFLGPNGAEAFATVQAHEDGIRRVAFTPDGRFIVTASWGDYHLKVWHAGDGSASSAQKHSHRLCDAAIALDGFTVITTDAYQHLVFWPLCADGQLGPGAGIKADFGQASLALSPNGKLLATVSYDKKLTLWDVAQKTKLQEHELPEPLRYPAFSPDGAALVAGTCTNTFYYWKLADGAGKTFTVPRVPPTTETWNLVFSPDGQWFSTAHQDSYLWSWKAPAMEASHFYNNAPMASVMHTAFSPDSQLLAAAFGDGNVYLYGPEAALPPKAVLPGFAKEKPAKSLAFSPDGKTLAAGGEDGKLILYRGK